MLQVEIIGLRSFESDLRSAGGRIEPLMRAATSNAAGSMQKHIRRMAPHRTGTLQRSVQAIVSHPHAMVTVNAKHGAWVEYGTSPHVILPIKAKALYWRGARYPVTRVQHPGTKANPFFRKGVDASIREVFDEFQKVVDMITHKLGGSL